MRESRFAQVGRIRADRADVGTGTLHVTEPCVSCGDPVVAVVVRATPAIVAMRSCNRCDLRWWTADGAPTDPLRVFARA